MVVVENTILSEDIFTEYFSCDIKKCKGICCQDGEAGAPLEEEEIPIIEKLLPQIRTFLSIEAYNVIQSKGAYVRDKKYGLVTPILDDGICVYALKNAETGEISCAFQQFFRTGQTDFYKPISCHLYPIRIKKTKVYELLNYERIDNCKGGCQLGNKLKMPLFEFVKSALIRKYNTDYYETLQAIKKRYFS